jgi:hypothetical protein
MWVLFRCAVPLFVKRHRSRFVGLGEDPQVLAIRAPALFGVSLKGNLLCRLLSFTHPVNRPDISRCCTSSSVVVIVCTCVNERRFFVCLYTLMSVG